MLILAFACGLAWQVLYRQELLAWLLQGAEPNTNWQAFLLKLYPRIGTELPRLGADFLIQKGDGTLLRLILLVPAAWWLWYVGMPWLLKPEPMHTHADLDREHWPYYAVVAFWGWFTADMLTDLMPRLSIASLYEGIPHFNWLWGSHEYANDYTLGIYSRLMLALGIALLQQRLNMALRITAAVFFFFSQYFLYGWGKIDHTYATLNWVLLAWVFPMPYTIRLMVLAIGATYTLAGVEKLLSSGIFWLADAPLFLKMQATEAGKVLADFPYLVYLLFAGAWAFQFFALPIIMTGRYLRHWLVTGLFFHLGTFLLFGAGAWLSPWYLGLLMINIWRMRQLGMKPIPEPTDLFE